MAARTPAACTWRHVRVCGALAAAGGRGQADSAGARAKCMRSIDDQRRHISTGACIWLCVRVSGREPRRAPVPDKLGWGAKVNLVSPHFHCGAALHVGLLTTAHFCDMCVSGERSGRAHRLCMIRVPQAITGSILAHLPSVCTGKDTYLHMHGSLVMPTALALCAAVRPHPGRQVDQHSVLHMCACNVKQTAALQTRVHQLSRRLQAA